MARHAIHIPMAAAWFYMTKPWKEGNVNDLCSLEYYDPITGFVTIKSVPCRVEKIQDKTNLLGKINVHLTQQCSAVILAGGQSKRMGNCKALLEVDGQPILSRLCQELSCFEPIFFRSISRFPPFPSFELVQDIFDDCGHHAAESMLH